MKSLLVALLAFILVIAVGCHGTPEAAENASGTTATSQPAESTATTQPAETTTTKKKKKSSGGGGW